MKKTKCPNPACGRLFTPSKFKPDQAYCGKAECARYRDALRQKKHYRKHIPEPDWRTSLMERKKRERARRLSRDAPLDDGQHPPSDDELMLDGVIAFVSGAKSTEELAEIRCKCLDSWRALHYGAG
jgi:hypothetical protein